MELALADTQEVINGWSIDEDGALQPANIDTHEFCIDVREALLGRDRLMAMIARLAGEEASALDDLMHGRSSADRYGAPLELETLQVNVSHFAEHLRRLSVSDRWPGSDEIAHIIRGNESSLRPRTYF